MIRLLLTPFAWFLNALPSAWVQCLGDIMGWFLFSVARFRRATVMDNLAIAYGAERSPKELFQIAKKNYAHYAKVILEWIQSITWSREDFRERTTLEWGPIQEQMTQKKGGLLFTSHLGNWEFAIQTVSAWGMPCDIIVKRQRTEAAQRFLNWYRTRFGARIIYETGTLREILSSLSSQRFVVFVLDQFMGPPIGLPVKFFGREAGTAVGLALISEKSKNSLFTSFNFRGEDGKIHVYIDQAMEPLTMSPEKEERLYQKTQWFNDILESQIRKHPEQWLWIHRRWKSFQGEPRWKLKRTLVTVFLTSVILSCSSQKDVATPTGIEIPADPSFSVPVYGSEDGTENIGTQPETPKKPLLPIEKRASSKKKTAALPKAVEKKTFSIVPVDKIPFEVGERLVVDLTWLALPAGQGVLEVREGPNLSGRPTFHLWGNVLSSKMVDTIYHVDNTIESYIDSQGFIPYKFLLSMFETAQKKETRVVFDHPKARTNYWSKRISQKWGDQDINRDDEIVPQSRDMFSALYYARALDYQLNKKQSFWIYENGQNLSVELLPVAKEVITTSAGVFQCWKIRVDVKINNVLKPTGDLFMWLSDDSKKYLVKFDAKVKIGSLLGRLVSIRER